LNFPIDEECLNWSIWNKNFKFFKFLLDNNCDYNTDVIVNIVSFENGFKFFKHICKRIPEIIDEIYKSIIDQNKGNWLEFACKNQYISEENLKNIKMMKWLNLLKNINSR
jgi:hypothetical protein